MDKLYEYEFSYSYIDEEGRTRTTRISLLCGENKKDAFYTAYERAEEAGDEPYILCLLNRTEVVEEPVEKYTVHYKVHTQDGVKEGEYDFEGVTQDKALKETISKVQKEYGKQPFHLTIN